MSANLTGTALLAVLCACFERSPEPPTTLPTPDPDRPRIKETRTGTQPNAFLASVLKEYGVHNTGFEGLVALRHKAPAAKLPPMRPAPVRTDDASRFAEASGYSGPVGTNDGKARVPAL